MYTYRRRLTDEEWHINDSQVLGGAAIGIILFGQTGYSFPPGSVENATTFNYPVLYRAVGAASVESVLSDELDPEVTGQLIEAGRELETQGCRAIIGACGYFANYLPQVAAELTVPCFFSSLMQVPLIFRSMGPRAKLLVLCADGRVLNSAPVLANCGVEDPSRLVISGAEVLPEMEKILAGVGHYNPVKLEQGLARLAREAVAADPDIRGVVLECSLFPSHARAVQAAVRMPVFDFATLIDWVYSGVVRHLYPGYQ